jgi:hypothetical protein
VGEYNPTTWPGVRLPHCWVKDSQPIQDLIPETYVLLKLGSDLLETKLFREIFEARGIPFTEIDISSDRIRDLYECNLILLRPDMHIAWRGTYEPTNALEITQVATGFGRS